MFFIRQHKVFFLFLFLLFAVYSYSQDKVTIRSGADKNSILIGERMDLSLEADFPLHEPMRFFAIDSIPHFEILERKKIDTVDNSEGIKLSQSFTLTSFDSGHWVIPSFELAGDNPLFTDSIPVNVNFSPFDPNKNYHDIKDIIEVHPVEKKKQDSYWYVVASVVLLGVIIYLLAGKRKKPAPEAKLIDPFTEARLELEKMQKENLSSKLFYTRLVDIFRVYVSRRREIASLQKTTDDLVIQLRRLKFAGEDFNQLAQTLRMSDSVKFAKYEPNETDKEGSLNTIKNSIDKIEKLSADSYTKKI